MNIVIIGGNGKLGKNICEKLTHCHHNIVCVDLNTEVKNIYNATTTNMIIKRYSNLNLFSFL